MDDDVQTMELQQTNIAQEKETESTTRTQHSHQPKDHQTPDNFHQNEHQEDEEPNLLDILNEDADEDEPEDNDQNEHDHEDWNNDEAGSTN